MSIDVESALGYTWGLDRSFLQEQIPKLGWRIYLARKATCWLHRSGKGWPWSITGLQLLTHPADSHGLTRALRRICGVAQVRHCRFVCFTEFAMSIGTLRSALVLCIPRPSLSLSIKHNPHEMQPVFERSRFLRCIVVRASAKAALVSILLGVGVAVTCPHGSRTVAAEVGQPYRYTGSYHFPYRLRA